jgi:hypothetical protein
MTTTVLAAVIFTGFWKERLINNPTSHQQTRVAVDFPTSFSQFSPAVDRRSIAGRSPDFDQTAGIFTIGRSLVPKSRLAQRRPGSLSPVHDGEGGRQ